MNGTMAQNERTGMAASLSANATRRKRRVTGAGSSEGEQAAALAACNPAREPP